MVQIIGIGLGLGFARSRGGGGYVPPDGSFLMQVPDLPTSKPGKGFTVTGFDIRGSDGAYYIADGTGKQDQNASGDFASAITRCIRNRDALALDDYETLATLMTGLEESAGVPVNAGQYSIQGVSWRSDTDKIILTCANGSAAVTWCLVVDPLTWAVSQANRFAASVNHFEPDEASGNYIAVSSTQIRRRLYTNLMNTGLGNAYTHGLGSTVDMLDFEQAGRLHVTSGSNGSNGLITTITTPADFGTASFVSSWTATGVLAIEGVRSRVAENELLIGDDPAYHLVGGAGAVNGIWAIRPNPLLP